MAKFVCMIILLCVTIEIDLGFSIRGIAAYEIKRLRRAGRCSTIDGGSSISDGVRVEDTKVQSLSGSGFSAFAKVTPKVVAEKVTPASAAKVPPKEAVKVTTDAAAEEITPEVAVKVTTDAAAEETPEEASKVTTDAAAEDTFAAVAEKVTPKTVAFAKLPPKEATKVTPKKGLLVAKSKKKKEEKEAVFSYEYPDPDKPLFVFNIKKVIKTIRSLRGKKIDTWDKAMGLPPHHEDSTYELQSLIPVSVIEEICKRANQVHLAQPNLLELEAPIIIVGSLHGDLETLFEIFDKKGKPPVGNYLFLGGYVNRGFQSIETMLLLLAYKIKYPENFFLLRGAHEADWMCEQELFKFESDYKYPSDSGNIRRTFYNMFNHLPLAAIINDKIFCVHGGLSPEIMGCDESGCNLFPEKISLKDRLLYLRDSFDKLQRPLVHHRDDDQTILNNVLWSDPIYDDPDKWDVDKCGWKEGYRGPGHSRFGIDVVAHFLKTFDFDAIVRSHEPCDDGYRYSYGKKLITLWSRPNQMKYSGEENDNDGVIMDIDDKGIYSFHILTGENYGGKRKMGCGFKMVTTFEGEKKVVLESPEEEKKPTGWWVS